MNYVTGQPSSIIVRNNLIANNGSNGVRIRCDTSLFINNTIVNNGGYGLFCDDYALYMRMVNCISWGNQYSSMSVLIPDTGVSYSDVDGLQMNADPNFVAASAGYGPGYDGLAANFNLQVSSPCINTGNPFGNYPLIDLSGDPRIVGGNIDMGAYEFQGLTDINAAFDPEQISVRPNPFNRSARVYLSENMFVQEAVMLDMDGRVVRIWHPQAGAFFLVDRGDLTSGVYLLKLLLAENRTSTIKLIIAE